MSDIFETNPTTNLFGGDADLSYSENEASADRGDDFEPTGDDYVEEGYDAEPDAIDAEDETDESDEAEEEVATAETDEESEPEADAREEKQEKAKKDSNPMVPRQRLNKEIQKRQQLEARVRELEQSAPQVGSPAQPVAPKEVVRPNKDAINSMFAAVLDGDEGKAHETFEQILTDFGSQVINQTREVAEGTYTHKQELEELRVAASEVMEQYPEFDQNSEEVDMGLTEEVLALRDTLIDRGEKPSVALRRAAKFVATENGLNSRVSTKSLAELPVKAKPKDVPKQIQKATTTPRKLKGDGAKNKEVKVDIMKLSDEQFGKLSREALAKARGDLF